MIKPNFQKHRNVLVKKVNVFSSFVSKVVCPDACDMPYTPGYQKFSQQITIKITKNNQFLATLYSALAKKHIYDYETFLKAIFTHTLG